METLKRKDRLPRHSSTMSATTKKFLQKICYRETASVDMTRYGFMKDSKVYPMNFLVKPLWQQLEKICGKEDTTTKKRVSERDNNTNRTIASPSKPAKYRKRNTKTTRTTEEKEHNNSKNKSLKKAI